LTFDVSNVSKKMQLPEMARLVTFKHSVLALCKGDDSWIQIRSGGQFRLRVDRSIVACSAADEWLGLTSSDFITTIFTIWESVPVWEFRSYQGQILCSALSAVFKIHVSGVADGTLDITSLTTGESVRVINLGKVTPIHIYVTPCWGFILTYVSSVEDGETRYELVVHTVNGKLVRRQIIPDALTHGVAFRSDSAFDYFGFIAKGAVFVCEVFYLDVRPLNFCVRCRPTGFQYVEEMAAFVITDAASVVTFVPFAPDEAGGKKDG
jgi:hypothetical protein